MKKLLGLILIGSLVYLWAAEGKDVTLKGEVMDLTCYFAHPKTGQGKGHAKCASKCIKNGLPVGLKTKEGVLYVATGSDHNAANELLAPHGGKVVSVTGTVKESDGVKMLFVKSVK